MHQRLSHESYTAGVMELATQVSNLPGADAPSSRVLEEGTVVRAFEDRRVQYSEEFRRGDGTSVCVVNPRVVFVSSHLLTLPLLLLLRGVQASAGGRGEPGGKGYCD